MNIAIAAITLDGKIAHNSADNTSWTSTEDKKFFASHTKQSGVVIFGRTTWETFQRPLPGRQLIIMTRTPQTSSHASVEFSTLPPTELIDDLHSRGYTDIFIAGGQQIYTLFFNSQLIDQLWLTIEPHLFGSQSISLFNELNTKNTSLQLLEVQKLNNHTLNLKYQVTYP